MYIQLNRIVTPCITVWFCVVCIFSCIGHNSISIVFVSFLSKPTWILIGNIYNKWVLCNKLTSWKCNQLSWNDTLKIVIPLICLLGVLSKKWYWASKRRKHSGIQNWSFYEYVEGKQTTTNLTPKTEDVRFLTRIHPHIKGWVSVAHAEIGWQGCHLVLKSILVILTSHYRYNSV